MDPYVPQHLFPLQYGSKFKYKGIINNTAISIGDSGPGATGYQIQTRFLGIT